MKTRQLLVAAAVLLGGVYVAAQVESPGNMDTTKTPEEIGASTSTAKPDGDTEGGSFENSSSTSTYDPSGARPAGERDIGLPDRERMENRRERRGGLGDDAGTESETDSGTESDTEPETQQQKP
jgi:hypothetical protein